MNEKKHTGDSEEMFTRPDESARQQKSAIFTVLSSRPIGCTIEKRVQELEVYSFERFRALARLQPQLTATRLARLARGARSSIECCKPDRYMRARWLEIAVAEIAQVRHTQSRQSDENSRALQQCLTRLLRQSFRSLDWRRPLIAGLRRPARPRI
jgi:hypothetical protein